PHYDHLVARAPLRLDERGRVVDADAFELGELGYVELSVLGAGRDDERARAHRLAVRELDVDQRRLARDADRAARDRELRPELLGLGEGAHPELLAGDAGGKAKIVFDPRARRGLPAGRAGLEDEHAQTLRGAVHRCREAARTGAADDEVVYVVGSELRV